ncbi:MAG: endonuclease/exonuclease/phosphatase family protein [Acidobacteriota bacterium]|nr:endonuclease/exonuclease/phosphatase family protein [Acidobacteriota bacterium]
MDLSNVTPEIAAGLKSLYRIIDKTPVAPSKLDQSINLATWNIRHFGMKPRSETSIYYIAAILNEFDLISITELNKDLGDLHRVMRVLGPHWRVVFSDFDLDDAGNDERMGYLYDERMVQFTGLAAEAGEPRIKGEDGFYKADFTWWRSPYMASFKAGVFDFVLLTAHIRWGGSSQAKRLKPIKELAAWVDTRVKSESVIDRDFIVLGDFNIPSLTSKLYKAVSKHGLRMAEAIARVKIGSNLSKKARYDQILHYPHFTNTFSNTGGVLDFVGDDLKQTIEALYPGQGLSVGLFKSQLSDHLPIWIQLQTDVVEEQLDNIINSV